MEPDMMGTHIFLSHLPPSSPPRAECSSAVRSSGALEVTVMSNVPPTAAEGNLAEQPHLCVVILAIRVSWLPALPRLQ